MRHLTCSDELAQPINIDALLSSIVEDEQALGRPVNLATNAGTPPSLPPYVGKLSVLKRAITNLIDNAVAQGSHVLVSVEDSEAALQVMVEDDGPGIPEADLRRVTEPFVRLDVARGLETGGVGLGLAIVKDAAAYHGGTLMLENRPSGGLRANLSLPRTTADRHPYA